MNRLLPAATRASTPQAPRFDLRAGRRALCTLLCGRFAGQPGYYEHSAYCPECQFQVCDPDYIIGLDAKGRAFPFRLSKRKYQRQT